MSFSRMFALWVAALGLCCGAAVAQDMPGSKDHPAVKRFAGSAIVGYEVRNFDEVDFQTSTFTGYDLKTRERRYAQPPLHQEGKLTRLWYEAPGETRALELYRNYVNDLTASGFKTLYDSTKDPAAKRWNNFLATFASNAKDFVKTSRSQYVMYAASESTLRTGTFQKDGTTVRLVAIDWPKADATYKAQQGAYIAVDILESQAMAQNMVVVSASEIGRAITATGKVAIYGIFFDTGKADVKPESAPSLEQIAAFLKQDTGARLHVVGHTDNVGGLDSNMQLSRRRAEAVSAALVKGYGIAQGRLLPNGVASLAPVASNAAEEGRARNRRVELVLQ